MSIEATNLARVREYLEERMYSLVDFRLGFEAPAGPSGFPKFEVLERVIARLSPKHRTLFRLLRLGARVNEAAVEQAIPAAVLETLANAGLLVRENQEWRTPGLLLVPIEGLLVFVGIPAAYPTAPRPPSVWFDLSSFLLAKSLPGSLRGERVLDICAGSGVQSLLCAARGALSVVGLELSSDGVEISRVNAGLNGLEDCIEFRVSDKLGALAEMERFDFILCNTPYAPVMGGLEPPETPAQIGNSVLFGLLEQLPRHLSENGRGIVAAWRSIGSQGATAQADRILSVFAEAGLSALVFVDRAPDTAEGVLRILQTDLAQRYGQELAGPIVASARELLMNSGSGAEFYNQLIYFRRGEMAASEDRESYGLAAAMAAGDAR
jgi:SAM-dependent methyltransferase